MIRLLTIGLMALGLMSTANASTLQEIADSTVKLYQNGQKQCSIQAVAYEDTEIWLTAQHCVSSNDINPYLDKEEFSIFLPELDEDFKKVTETHHYLDWIYTGRLSLGEDVAIGATRSGFMLDGVDLATPEQIANLKIGDVLTAVGYPSAGLSDDLYIATGNFLGYTQSPGAGVKGKWIKTSIPVDYGSSGGGLYLEEDGEYYLVSVTSQKDFRSNAPMSYYTDPATVLEAIEKAVSK